MEKKQKWQIALMAIFMAVAVSCAILLIVFSNQMFLNGSSGNRILGIVLLAVGFLLSIGMFSVLITSYKFDKNKTQLSQKNQE